MSNRQAKMRGWLTSRCYVPSGDVPTLPAEVRALVRRAFQSLTEPHDRTSPIRWALADVSVNGQASAGICAVIGDVAVPVFVMPVAGTLLHNGRGDALRVERHWLLGREGEVHIPRLCPCNVAMPSHHARPRRKGRH